MCIYGVSAASLVVDDGGGKEGELGAYAVRESFGEWTVIKEVYCVLYPFGGCCEWWYLGRQWW